VTAAKEQGAAESEIEEATKLEGRQERPRDKK